MSAGLDHVTWPIAQLGDAIAELARRSGLDPRDVFVPPPNAAALAGGAESLDPWVTTVAQQLGIDAESVESTYAEVGTALEGCGPAIWTIANEAGAMDRCVAIVSGKHGVLRLLHRAGGVARVPTERVREAVVAHARTFAKDQIEAILDLAGIAAGRRGPTREALLTERFGYLPLPGCFILRPHAGSSFWAQARHARVHRLALRLVAMHGVGYLLMLASWWTLGHGALDGRFDPWWLVAWVLLLATAIPFRLMSSWAESLLSLRLGRLLKQRLLAGTFRLKPDLVRNEGSGELLGRVIESEAVESLMTTGGFTAITALVEVVVVAWLFLHGPSGPLHLASFAAWIGLTAVVSVGYFRRRKAWTGKRLELSRELVERMLAHRTRLAQQAPERWHQGEDASVATYVEASTRADHASILLSALVGRGWIIVGLAGLLPAFIATGTSPQSLAVGLGATMLADRALQKLTGGVRVFCDAMISWRAVRPIFEAAADREPPGVPGVAAHASAAPAAPDTLEAAAAAAPLIEAHGLTFRHEGRAEAVIDGCDLTIRARDRILLESPSGGGKSSLAALLTSLRTADAGLLLFHGFDRRTLGTAAWRRGIVAAPQFHENHVFASSFAFNVLMGRRWPASDADLEDAEAICRELGLGPLLDRMPGGMRQSVGESGWQLSHGERSRVFIARALVQKADVVILDESFAALDPENLGLALECVSKRTNALLVIAHP